MVEHLRPGAVAKRLGRGPHTDEMALPCSSAVVAETQTLNQVVLVGVEVRVKQALHCWACVLSDAVPLAEALCVQPTHVARREPCCEW